MIRSLYSDGTGLAYLELSDGLIPPPRLCGLYYWGTLEDLMTRLNYRMKQSEIAQVAGVGQQAVSRYINGGSAPRLSDGAVLKLIRLDSRPV